MSDAVLSVVDAIHVVLDGVEHTQRRRRDDRERQAVVVAGSLKRQCMGDGVVGGQGDGEHLSRFQPFETAPREARFAKSISRSLRTATAAKIIADVPGTHDADSSCKLSE